MPSENHWEWFTNAGADIVLWMQKIKPRAAFKSGLGHAGRCDYYLR
jgi:hypothetical protein